MLRRGQRSLHALSSVRKKHHSPRQKEGSPWIRASGPRGWFLSWAMRADLERQNRVGVWVGCPDGQPWVSLLGSWNHHVLNNGKTSVYCEHGWKRDVRSLRNRKGGICNIKPTLKENWQNLASHCKDGMKREAGQRRLRGWRGVWQRKGQVGGRTQGTDVRPGLPVSRKHAWHTWSVLLLLSSKREMGKILVLLISINQSINSVPN